MLARTLANVVVLRYRPSADQVNTCVSLVLERINTHVEDTSGGHSHTAQHDDGNTTNSNSNYSHAASLVLWAAMYARRPLAVEVVSQLLCTVAASSCAVSNFSSTVIVRAVVAATCMFADHPDALEELREPLQTLLQGLHAAEVHRFCMKVHALPCLQNRHTRTCHLKTHRWMQSCNVQM